MVAANIMIVEDRDMISQAITDMLTINGYEISTIAEDGRTALDNYDRTRPDLILLDLLLPDMNGIDVAREILHKDPKASIVVITATTKEGIVEECRKVGIKRLIRKPFGMKELLSTIEDVLSND